MIMILTKNERDLLIKILEEYGDDHELWELPQDENGKYYSDNPDSPNLEVPYDEGYMDKEDNLIQSIINKI